MSLGPAPSRRMANASACVSVLDRSRSWWSPGSKCAVRRSCRSRRIASRIATVVSHASTVARVGWRRMSCIHAKEQASSTLASDVLTTSRTRPRKAAWCLAKSSASSPQSGAGGTRPPGVSATPPGTGPGPPDRARRAQHWVGQRTPTGGRTTQPRPRARQGDRIRPRRPGGVRLQLARQPDLRQPRRHRHPRMPPPPFRRALPARSARRASASAPRPAARQRDGSKHNP